MKHPQLRVLQDYIEYELNEVQSELVREHLLNCDQCSNVLAQMAKVDTRVRQRPETQVSEAARARLFADASALLARKRQQIAAEKRKVQEREEAMQDWRELFQNFLGEFRVPALQLAGLSAAVAILIVMNQTESITVYKPLSESVGVHGHLDLPQDYSQGEHE